MALLTPMRHNRHVQHPAALARAIAQFRQIIETLNSQLAERFDVERNRAESVLGPYARLQVSLATHPPRLFLNCAQCSTSWPPPSSSTKGHRKPREET